MHLVHVANVTEKDGERARERARGRRKEQARGRDKGKGRHRKRMVGGRKRRGGKGREKAVDAPGEGADAKLTFDSCFFQHTPPRN